MLRSKKNKKILLASYSGAHKMRWPKESLGSSSVFHHRGPQWRNAASEQHIGKRISSKERSSQEAQHDGNFLVFLGLCLLALHAFLWLLDVRLWLFVLVFPYKFPVRLNRWLIEGVLPSSSHTCRLSLSKQYQRLRSRRYLLLCRVRLFHVVPAQSPDT